MGLDVTLSQTNYRLTAMDKPKYSRQDVDDAIKKLKPRRFYEELADAGALMEFIDLYMQTHISNDNAFRREIVEMLLDRPEFYTERSIELALGELCQSLSFFWEYTSPCRK